MSELTIDDIRKPGTQSGFNHVSAETVRRPRAQVYGGAKYSNGLQWYGPRRPTVEQAAQDYCDYINGSRQALVERVEREPNLDLQQRERITREITRKAGWPASMRKAIIRRARGRCARCGCGAWCGEAIVLQADHIDPQGDHSLENGQALCGNCHDLKTRRERR